MTYTVQEIADKIGGQVHGDGKLQITGVAKIEEAEKGTIAFLANTKYAKYLGQSQASAIIVPPDLPETSGKTMIRVENPYYAFMKTVVLFHPPQPLIEPGIHPTALIDEETEIGKNVAIGPYVVVGKRCRIGDNTIILSGVSIEDDVTVGKACLLYPHVSLRNRVILGDRVILHNGVVVGSDGFGYAKQDGIYHKIPQVGIVVIEDDVEIGANAAIDRATMGETRIEKGTKLDNLIQIGHNCTIGENTVIAAQTGLSGSTHIGKGVMVGGQVGFAGHMTVGDGAIVGAKSGVSKSVPPGIMVSGAPARAHRDELHLQAAMKRLPDIVKEIQNLERAVEELKKLAGKE